MYPFPSRPFRHFDLADGIPGRYMGVDFRMSQASGYAEDENLVDNDSGSWFRIGLVPRLQAAEHHKACEFDRRRNCCAAKYWRKEKILKGF